METINVIQCPHCEEKMDFEDYIDIGDMEGDFEMDCEFCSEKFKVSFSTDIKFITSK